MLLPVTNVCYSCGRKLPPSPRSNALAQYACSVAHVRADGSLCSVGLTAIVPSHDADELVRDDARWSDEFHAPMFRYIHHDRPIKWMDRMLELGKKAVLAELERAESTFWDRQIAIVADEYMLRWGSYFDAFPVVYKNPPITDRDPGDEQPVPGVRFAVRALPRW